VGVRGGGVERNSTPQQAAQHRTRTARPRGQGSVPARDRATNYLAGQVLLFVGTVSFTR